MSFTTGTVVASVPGWIVAQTGTGPEFLGDYWPAVERAGWFLLGFLVVLAIGWIVLTPLLSRTVERRNENNPTITEAIRRYFRVLVVVIAVFVGAGIAGYGRFLSDSALVIAAGTLAIGVAGQTVIGSLISGLVLVFDPEFNVGNYVECEACTGVIKSITLRVTRLQTPAGELVTVPNTVLTSQAITRPYSQRRRRVTERILIDYEDDLDTAITELEAAVAEIDTIRDDPSPRVYVSSLESDAVELGVHYWLDDPRNRNVLEIQSRFVSTAKARLEDAGITISPVSKRDLEGRIEVADTN